MQVACDILESAMTDFHHNVFYYYRGAQRSDRDREQQLEDNTTKALINTLDHCSRTVALMFLAQLGIEATEPVECELQKATISGGEIGSKSQRLLLGIVPSKEEENSCAKWEESVEGDSLPDAWLYGDDYVVLVESKVVGSLELDQMRRHFQKLRMGTDQQPKCKVCTWAEVHQFFKVLPDDELTDRDKWIIGQLTQYLEWIGMAEFTGLEPGMFDYFAARIDDRDEDDRQWVRGTMRSFAEKVLDKLQILDGSFYQGYHAGQLQLKDDHCWVAFGPGNTEFKLWAHQTMSLYAHGLDVFVNVELKPAVVRLRKKISQDKQTFREAISRLPVPFSVQLEERKQKQASQHNYYTIARLEAGCREAPNLGQYGLKDPKLGQHGFNYIEKLLEQIHLPYLSVRRCIDRNRALELSQGGGHSLVDEVVGIMKDFHPLVEFINEGAH
jgi:hypothetical protein